MSVRDVLILGHRGMLGSVVARWLGQNGCRVATTDTRYRAGPDDLIAEVGATSCTAVINCIGTTPRRARDDDDLFAVNALLPQRLAAVLGSDRLLIHASSDAVFDGVRGNYRVDELPNATDAYGLSKRLGELAVEVGRTVVIRTSIVGCDPGEPRSLLSWFLSQRDAVTGFTDHHWNGVTCLQWASVALRALSSDPEVGPGIHQPGCIPAVTKFELLSIAGRTFGHEIPVRPRPSDSPVNRVLVPTIPCPAIDEQLAALRAWTDQIGVPCASRS